jgi:DNA-binding transcriptional LysR family regulator
MDKLGAMRTFRRVVELGSFTAAARDLAISNAGVSKHVAELESELGVTLLTRTTRRIALTETGRAYFERCQQILDDIAEAETATAALQAAPRGLLRVTVPMSFGLLHIAPAIAGFMERYPDLRIDLQLNDRVADLVEEGLDIALRVRTVLEDSSLIARRLCFVERVLCASPRYLARQGTPRALADLAQHRCLTFALSPTPNEWSFDTKDGIARVRVESALIATNSLALREAVLRGAGIALIPTFVIGPDLKSGALVRLLPVLEPARQTLFALYPPNRHLAPKVRVFLDFLVDLFSGTPPWDR